MQGPHHVAISLFLVQIWQVCWTSSRDLPAALWMERVVISWKQGTCGHYCYAIFSQMVNTSEIKQQDSGPKRPRGQPVERYG